MVSKRLLRAAVHGILRRYTVAMWPLLGARPVENRLEEALAFAQLLQLNPLVRGVRLSDVARAANDALHAGALELAGLGAVAATSGGLLAACGDDDDGILQARSAAEPRQSRASASRAFDGGVCLCARALEFTST